MCNLYDIGPGPARQARGWEREVVSVLGSLPKLYGLRRTDRGVVVRRDRSAPEAWQATPMRWGFRREFSDCINNARTDKLDSPTWTEAWRERRCVIPASAFYEWSGGEKGAKQTYALEDPAAPGNWLWMAGLWEADARTGELCYAMLTRDASGPIAAIHDRMPVILPTDRVEAFLQTGPASEAAAFLDEARDDLRMYRCLNPLKTAQNGPPVEESFLF